MNQNRVPQGGDTVVIPRGAIVSLHFEGFTTTKAGRSYKVKIHRSWVRPSDSKIVVLWLSGTTSKMTADWQWPADLEDEAKHEKKVKSAVGNLTEWLQTARKTHT